MMPPQEIWNVWEKFWARELIELTALLGIMLEAEK